MMRVVEGEEGEGHERGSKLSVTVPDGNNSGFEKLGRHNLPPSVNVSFCGENASICNLV